MYKALVLITKPDERRSNTTVTEMKVELQDTNLNRLVDRVTKHLQIVQDDNKPTTSETRRGTE